MLQLQISQCCMTKNGKKIISNQIEFDTASIGNLYRAFGDKDCRCQVKLYRGACKELSSCFF